MTARSWLGNAAAVTDIWTISIGGTWVAADTITISATLNGVAKTLVTTVGSLVTVAQVCATLAQSFNGTAFTDTSASELPLSPRVALKEFAEYAATVPTAATTVVLAHVTPGYTGPTFTISKSSASGTASISNTTVGTGPYSWDNTANWTGATVPVGGDDITINVNVPILFGLAQSGVTLNSLTIGSAFFSRIGLPALNANGYAEYRATELAISATTVTIYGGATLIKINYGSVASTTTVYSTGISSEVGKDACQLRGTNTGGALKVLGASNAASADVGWGANGETCNLATLVQTSGSVTIGTAVSSLTTITQIGDGCVLNNFSACTTLNADGIVNHYSGAITTVNLTSSYTLFTDYSTSTFTTLNVNNGAAYVADGNVGAKTITNSTVNLGSITDVADRIVFTNATNWKGKMTIMAP